MCVRRVWWKTIFGVVCILGAAVILWDEFVLVAGTPSKNTGPQWAGSVQAPLGDWGLLQNLSEMHVTMNNAVAQMARFEDLTNQRLDSRFQASQQHLADAHKRMSKLVARLDSLESVTNQHSDELRNAASHRATPVPLQKSDGTYRASQQNFELSLSKNLSGLSFESFRADFHKMSKLLEEQKEELNSVTSFTEEVFSRINRESRRWVGDQSVAARSGPCRLNWTSVRVWGNADLILWQDVGIFRMLTSCSRTQHPDSSG